MTTEPTTEVIDQGAPNTVAINRDLKYELAATYARVLELKDERKELTSEIKELDDRMKEILAQIKQGGTQLAMNFATQADPATIEEPEETDEEGDGEDEEPEH